MRIHSDTPMAMEQLRLNQLKILVLLLVSFRETLYPSDQVHGSVLLKLSTLDADALDGKAVLMS